MATDVVSSAWLQEHLNDPQCRVIDCRWVLGEAGAGRRQYDERHIPGSVHMDVEEHLSARDGPGRHPLPLKRDFQKVMSGIGIGRETRVIAYDGGLGLPAARLWWLLKFYGHDKASVLDGGWPVWVKEGRPVDTEIRAFQPADFVARPKRKWVADKDLVDALRDDTDVLLIDARAPERYQGTSEPLDSRPGHIPGARNLHYSKISDPETGLFLPPEKLRPEFEKLGTNEAKTIICYCGSGVTACTNILALKLAGFDSKIDIKLYEGSWSDWSRDLELPAATGKNEM